MPTDKMNDAEVSFYEICRIVREAELQGENHAEMAGKAMLTIFGPRFIAAFVMKHVPSDLGRNDRDD